MRLALFDLDNTLLAGDSDFEWARFLVDEGVLDREVHEARNREFYEQYQSGALVARHLGEADLAAIGRVSGIPCFREGKVARLEDWLAGRGLRWPDVTESWFYSDSLNDLFLLEKVDHPVAVDPTARSGPAPCGWAGRSSR